MRVHVAVISINVNPREQSKQVKEANVQIDVWGADARVERKGRV